MKWGPMRSKLNIDKLRTFYLIVKQGSVKQAAEYQGMSISGLTRQIAALEEEIGHKLFRNVHQRLVLTPKGELLYERVGKILSEIDSAVKYLDEDDSEVNGNLTLSTTNSISVLWLMDDLADFLKAHPQLKLTVLGSDFAHDLSIREADVAIRPYISDLAGLCQDYLLTYRLNLYASESYIKQFGLPKNIQELEKHQLVGYTNNEQNNFCNFNWHLKLLKNKVKPYISINTGAGILRAVENGLGIGPISQQGEKNSRVPLVRVLPDIQGSDVDIYFSYPEDLMFSRRVLALKDYLQKRFQKQEFLKTRKAG